MYTVIFGLLYVAVLLEYIIALATAYWRVNCLNNWRNNRTIMKLIKKFTFSVTIIDHTTIHKG